MRVIVSGGAGFIGSHIVDGLIEAGHHPVVIDDFSTGFRRNIPDDVPVYTVDVCDGRNLASIFDEVRPDWVCHQAAQMSVSRSMCQPALDAQINIVGLLNILENSARCRVKRITFASSGGVLYGNVSKPAREDSPLLPISPYGISKHTGEKYLQFFAREHGLEAVALRYSNVYGPRQSPHGEAGVVAIFSTKLLRGEPATINGDGMCVRDYVHVSDVVRANVLALEKKLPSKFVALNIGTGLGTDVNELARLIRGEVQAIRREEGTNGEVPRFQHGKPRVGDLTSNLVSPALAQQILAWTPRIELANGIVPTVQWFNHAGKCNLLTT